MTAFAEQVCFPILIGVGKLGVALAIIVLLVAGCTRVIYDGHPEKARPVGPIAAGQVEDLVSTNARGGDAGTSLFAKVTPGDCAGLVQEVRAPFIHGASPVAHTGGIFHDDRAAFPGNVVEIVGVYHSDFDSLAAVDVVRRTIESCRNDMLTATGLDDRDVDHFSVRSRPDSGSPQIVLWSLTDVADWACDNAFVAAHNAAIELTACQDRNGFDVLALAQDALRRIEALANATT